jgi:hypothetical protein
VCSSVRPVKTIVNELKFYCAQPLIEIEIEMELGFAWLSLALLCLALLCFALLSFTLICLALLYCGFL